MMTIRPTKNIKCFDGWKGMIRRLDWNNKMALIEWDYCGGLPTDICSWVAFSDLMNASTGASRFKA